MKDRGTVVRIQDGLAWVKVSPQIACCECSARALCSAKQDKEGKLAVRNPVGARAGDEVEIEVPETDYSRSLIVIFGSLLAASLAGLAIGYSLSPIRNWEPGANGFVGLLAGLAIGALVIHRHFRAGRRDAGWPTITFIFKKGEFHG